MRHRRFPLTPLCWWLGELDGFFVLYRRRRHWGLAARRRFLSGRHIIEQHQDIDEMNILKLQLRLFQHYERWGTGGRSKSILVVAPNKKIPDCQESPRT